MFGPSRAGLLGTLLSAVIANSGTASAHQDPACGTTAVDAVCQCDLTQLRPLQGAVGLAEVARKAADIDVDRDKAWRKLGRDPIRVVAGPDGGLYIIDHHHTALAWLRVEHGDNSKIGRCQVEAVHTRDNQVVAFATMDEFQAALERSDVDLVRLKDENGSSISFDALPKTLEALKAHDDPYRSLAGIVRRNDGFCRSVSNPEFVEFIWADFFRDPEQRLPVADVRNLGPESDESAPVVNSALGLAHSDTAEKKGLPGFTKDSSCPN